MLIDTASQISYIIKKAMTYMAYDTTDQSKEIIHKFYWGQELRQKDWLYKIFVSSIGRDNICRFEIMDISNTCVEFPRVNIGR